MGRLNQCWSSLLVLAVVVIGTGAVPITYLQSAVAKGAVCLDGSAPAYHFDKGFGSGVNNWIVHMEGGGWCTDVASCNERKGTMKGSSKFMNKDFGFSGILGGKQSTNPDFYNWNRIKVRYCDGSSFTGNVEAVNPANKLFFRGARVWRAVIDDLMARGMKNAQNAILSGCSAGALAAILHCDTFRAILPRTASVKCVSDAGYFIHGKDITGGSYIESYYSKVVALHGSAKSLPVSCTSKMKPELCFFPQYVVPSMRTPLFVINAAYDSWQIKNVLAPTAVDKGKQWKNCKLDLKKCSAAQLKTVQGFRDQMMRALSPVHSTPSRGLFLDSCHAHCQGGSAASWSGDKGPQVANTRIAKAVGNWFYGRSAFQKIDCPAWGKWVTSGNVGSSGNPLKAAILINYDPTGPSRLLSTIAEQEGIDIYPVDLKQFIDFMRRGNLPTETFVLGSNQYIITSIHENWFAARCLNTSQPTGEGAIVMQTAVYVLVALYDGSIGSASQAVAAADQFASQLSRKNF
ncbi:unnamed protein product [Arabidopsis halleri]